MNAEAWYEQQEAGLGREFLRPRTIGPVIHLGTGQRAASLSFVSCHAVGAGNIILPSHYASALFGSAICSPAAWTNGTLRKPACGQRRSSCCTPLAYCYTGGIRNGGAFCDWALSVLRLPER